MDLIQFVTYHTTRGECTCGKCFDVKDVAPIPALFGAHTIDMEFFKVAILNAPARDEFVQLIKKHMAIASFEVNPLDCEEHNYQELGGWIGDQGLAMLFMALGTHLGVFNLLTPNIVMPNLDKGTRQMLAGQGFITVKAWAGRVRSAEEQAKHEAGEKEKSLGESISTIASTAAADFKWNDEKVVGVMIDFLDELVSSGKVTAAEFHDYVMAARAAEG